VISLLLLVGGGVGLHITGWLLGAPLGSTLVALSRRRFLDRLVTDGIAPGRRVALVSLLLLGAGFAVSIVHASFIALHFATR
jgi:hypothetical protein